MSTSTATGLAYDAASILGFGPKNTSALPQANPGDIVLRYGGWSLRDLRDNPLVREKKIMYVQNWYDSYPWSAEKLPSGIYVLRLPVPDSDRKAFEEQKTLLLPGEEPVPVVLAATAMLAHLVSAGERILAGYWLRCKEQAEAHYRVELLWDDGRLDVNDDFGDIAYVHVWSASARKAS